MFSTRIVKSITDVGRDDWDDMVDDYVLMSHGWLKTLEETVLTPLDLAYILLEESGRLVGAAVCENVGSWRFDEILLGRLKERASGLGISFGPVLDCNPYRSYGKTFLVERGADPARKKSILNELFTTVERRAESAGCSIGFSKLMDNEPELLEMLKDRGFSSSITSPMNYVDIEWSSFSEYRRSIATLSRNMESNIRKEINKNKREGTVIQPLRTVEGAEDRLMELATMNQMKHNKKPFPFRSNFFSRLKANLGDDAVLYAAVKGREIIGLSVMLRRNRTAFTPIVGIDHGLSQNDATYFNICFYRPIADAIEQNMSRVHYGFGMYELKARRGCRIRPVYCYFKSSNKMRDLAARGWLAVRSAWWERKGPYGRLNRIKPGDLPGERREKSFRPLAESE